MSGRERHNVAAQADKVFRLGRKHHAAVGQVAVIKRADADGVSRGDKLVGLAVINYHRKLGIEHGEHIRSELAVHRQDDLAVGLAVKLVLILELIAHRLESVKLAVAHDAVVAQRKRLHAAFVKAHDRQPVEAQARARHLLDAGHVRPSRDRSVEELLRLGSSERARCETHD